MIDTQTKASLQLAILDWLRSKAEKEKAERIAAGLEVHEAARILEPLFETHLGVANVPGADFTGIDMGTDILTGDQVAFEAMQAAVLALEAALEHARMSNAAYRSEEW